MRVAWSIKQALVVMKLKSKSDDLVRVPKGGLLLIHSPKNLYIGFTSSSYGQLLGIKKGWRQFV